MSDQVLAREIIARPPVRHASLSAPDSSVLPARRC